jgi:hypothetical protein
MDTWADIEGFDYFDYNGVSHLVAAAGGKIYRSTDNAQTWTVCTGAFYSVGHEVNMNQNGNYLYITNGVDNIIRYDGTTTLSTYTTLATPNAPTVAETGLAGTGYKYYYKQSRVNTVGFSVASAASTVVESSLARESWDATTNFAVVTPATFVATQTRCDIYISENDVDYFYLASTFSDGQTFKDDGTSIPVPGTSAPTENTSQGPKVEELTNVGSRMYGVRDMSNRYRIWFSGAGQFAGAFAGAYDGGYLDWQEGGKLIPTQVKDNLDGKGNPVATIWCDSADGQGGILNMTLETLTIGDISITVPSAYLLPGSRGTPAPGSVVNVLKDYYFYNSQAEYNLGPRAQFLNLVSTDEMSANIRPDFRQINNAAESGIASTYFDARIYISVPYGNATANDHTIIYDTERKAWLPKAFTLGFKKFLRYTDTDGNRRLLALKPGDSVLSEISEDIQGDYGEPFETTLITGLYPLMKNRFGFQWVEEGEVEFSNPTGNIDVEVIGIERATGYGSLGTAMIHITAQLLNTGWGTTHFGVRAWGDVDTSELTNVTSEPSVKRYFYLGKELNAVQWRVVTNSLDASYVLRTLQTWGTDTEAGKPRTWRMSLM